MNKKLIAAAVSAAVVAPVAAYGEATVYGSITNAIKLVSPDAANKESSTNLAGLSSRIGFKASSDLGNGLTASAKLELGVVSDDNISLNDNDRTPDDDDGGDDKDPFDKTRVATVGLSGGFGSVTLGQQWSAYFNTFGTLVSPTYTVGHAASPNQFRTGNTIQYANAFGPIGLQVDVRLDEGDGTDANEKGGTGIGLTLNLIENLTIGVASDSQEKGAGNDDADNFGISAKYNFGPVQIAAGVQNEEEGDAETDGTVLLLSGNFTENTSWLLAAAEAENEKDVETSSTTWGIYHSLGGGLTLLYEAVDTDKDNDAGSATHWLAMRLKF